MDITAQAVKLWTASFITGSARWQLKVFWWPGVLRVLSPNPPKEKNGDCTFYHNTMQTLHKPLVARPDFCKLFPFLSKTLGFVGIFLYGLHWALWRLLTLRAMYKCISNHVFHPLDNILSGIWPGMEDGGATGRVLRGKSVGRCCTRKFVFKPVIPKSQHGLKIYYQLIRKTPACYIADFHVMSSFS